MNSVGQIRKHVGKSSLLDEASVLYSNLTQWVISKSKRIDKSHLLMVGHKILPDFHAAFLVTSDSVIVWLGRKLRTTRNFSADNLSTQTFLGLWRVPPHERGEERVTSLRTSAWEATWGIWNRSFICPVRPTVHTNLSRKRSFSKTLFKPEEFENADFSFSCEPKPFWKQYFENDGVTTIIWFPWPSFLQTQIKHGWWLLCF